MWILILTLITSTGTAITTAEFDGKNACEIAGQTWKQSINKGFGGNRPTIEYNCVSKEISR